MLTKTFSASGNQQEILARYRPFMVSSAQSDRDINVAHLAMRGRAGIFRLAPRLRITAKAEEQGERTDITLRVSPNLSFWLVLVFCAVTIFLALQAMRSMVRWGFLLVPLAMIVLDVVELWWQAGYCMDRLQKVAMEQ